MTRKMGATSRRLFLLGFLLLLCGCSSAPEISKDLRTLPQDSSFYLSHATGDDPLISRARQLEFTRKFNEHFYLPWHRSKPSLTKEHLLSEFQHFRENPGYGENAQKHGNDWIEHLEYAANLERYPNTGYRAITLDNTAMRVLPTPKPHFTDMEEFGGGYPFDNLQKSAIAANTPLYICHVTRDKSWVLAESHYAQGWIPSRDVASVNDPLVEAWEESHQIAVLRDDTPVYDSNGIFLFMASIGWQFPLVGEDAENYRIWVAVPGGKGTGRLETTVVSKKGAILKPFGLSQSNIAKLVNELMGKPYGWGGLFQNRDCSAMLKDLFAPFGIWLPRHSSHQAKSGGTFLNLGDLSPEAKEKTIREKGVPFLTLLWPKGHIMLYLGSFNGQIVAFHNMWRVKTKDSQGRERRRIVGYAAITTLHPGADPAHSLGISEDLMNRLEGMTLLAQPETLLNH